MENNSECVLRTQVILRTHFGEEPVIDTSRGEPNLTFRDQDKNRYRVYVQEEFEEDYPVMRGSYDSILQSLPEALRRSSSRTVLVTRDGIDEYSAPL